MQNSVNTEMQKTSICLSHRLKMLRKTKTQAEFSRELGVLQQTYARWELGDRQPKLQDLAALAIHFGVTTDWLLGLNEDGSISSVSTLETKNGIRQKITTLKDNADAVATKAKELLSAISEMEKDL